VSGRSVRAGETILLRARFKDDLGDPAQAGDVFVHVFEPSTDTTDLTEALVVSGVPTFLGQGIFEYSFDVPDCGPDGTWTDQWEGELTSFLMLLPPVLYKKSNVSYLIMT
jgi:hypothetical protein